MTRAHDRAWREAHDGILPTHTHRIYWSVGGDGCSAMGRRLRRERRGRVDNRRPRRRLRVRRLLWSDTGTKAIADAGQTGLKAIYVDPDGYGTTSFDRGIELRHDSGTILRLETLSENCVARRFYESGVEITDTGRFDTKGEYYATGFFALR